MGNFRIEIEAVGGHGSRRDVGDGGALSPERPEVNHIDHVIYDTVDALKARGASIVSAKLIHWPGQDGEVVDDVLAHTRKGSF